MVTPSPENYLKPRHLGTWGQNAGSFGPRPHDVSMEARRPPLIAVQTPQEQAALELAKSGSPRRAARIAGVPVSVVKSWQKDPEFAALVLENRSTDLILTVSTLMSAGPMAAQTLVDQLGARKGKRDGRGPDAVTPERRRSTKVPTVYSDPRKIRAARIILDNIFRFAETIEFMERIKALEEKARVSHNAGVPLEGRVIDMPSAYRDDETAPPEPAATEGVPQEPVCGVPGDPVPSDSHG